MFIRTKKLKDSHQFQIITTYRDEKGNVKQELFHHIGTLKLAAQYKGQGTTLESCAEYYDALSKGQLFEKYFNGYDSEWIDELMGLQKSVDKDTGWELTKDDIDNYIIDITQGHTLEGRLKYLTSLRRRLVRERKLSYIDAIKEDIENLKFQMDG